MLISYIMLMVMMLVGVGYFVVLERKILSSVHLRLGPKKSGFLGLFQPLCDGGKLFSKELNWPLKGNMIFFLSPILGMILCFLMWFLYIMDMECFNMKLGLLFFFCLSAMGVYVVVLGGWGSSSIYAVIGSYRGVAQSISYEVVMVILIMGVTVSVGDYELNWFLLEKVVGGVCILSMLVWLSIALAETNRSPYDFVEGESELVSGFNVEYSSVGFSLFFLMEYGMILFICFLSGVMFLGSGGGMMMVLFMMMVVIIRGVLPRFRYDKLMSMVWKWYLLYSLCCVFFFSGLKSMFVVIG